MKYQDMTQKHLIVSYEYNPMKCFAQYCRLPVELHFSCNVPTDNLTQ